MDPNDLMKHESALRGAFVSNSGPRVHLSASLWPSQEIQSGEIQVLQVTSFQTGTGEVEFENRGFGRSACPVVQGLGFQGWLAD